MKKTILLLSFFLIGFLPALAQVDTVVTIKHLHAVGKVKKLPMAWENMKINLATDPEWKVKSHPMKNLSYIRFADGFRVDYLDGEPVRANLISCPTLVPLDSKIMVEGLFPLTEGEIQALYGPKLYALEHATSKFQFKVGAWQASLGLAEFLLIGLHTLNQTKVENAFYDFNYPGPAAWTLSTNYLFVTMILSGLFNVSMGRESIQNTLYKRDQSIMSYQQAKKEFWWGVAGMSVGIGTLIYTSLDWKHHLEAKDEVFPTATWLAMIGGAALTNISFCYVLKGGSRMRAYSQLNLAPNGITLSF